MIATKQPRFSTSSPTSTSTSTSNPAQQSVQKSNQNHNQNHLNENHQDESRSVTTVGSEASQEPLLGEREEKNETRSEKKVLEKVAAQHKPIEQHHQEEHQQQHHQPHHNQNPTYTTMLGKKSNSASTGQAGTTMTSCCSVKIQQKQQKFLAAAAKSGTSPTTNSSRASSVVNASNNNKKRASNNLAQQDQQAAEQVSSVEKQSATFGQPTGSNPSSSSGKITLGACPQVACSEEMQRQPSSLPALSSQTASAAPDCHFESLVASSPATSTSNLIASASASASAPTDAPSSNAKQQVSSFSHHHQPFQHQQMRATIAQESHLTRNVNNCLNQNQNNHQSISQLQRQPNHTHTTTVNINNNQQQHQNQLIFQQQHPQQHQSHNMAHYKFHNDCQSSVLTYEQVKRLDFVMDQIVPIHGRGNYPTLYVKLKELIRLVKHKLQTKHSIEISDVRLNGGAASYVLAPENSHYNDLDLILGIDLSNEDQFDVIRDVVLECLKEFYPKEQGADLHSYSYSHPHSHSYGMAGDDSFTIDNDENDIRGQQHSCDSIKSNQGDPSEQNNINEDEEEVEEEDEDDDDDDDDGNDCSCEAKDSSREELDDCINNVQTDNQIVYKTQNPHYQHHQQSHYQMPLSNCAIKEAYVHKMVKVNDDDRWSLISLGVQQSEANCCNQATFSLPMSRQRNNNNQCDDNNSCQQQQQKGLNQQQFAFTNTINNENETTGLNLKSQSSSCAHINMVSDENSPQPHYQISYQPINQQHIDQRNHYQHQHKRKQFPNSIELKFVDRMRRKFEFSVDSFQIILDSLIQFYDYAPQSTIASQKILINSHPSSTMVNTRPLISKRRCSGACANVNQKVLDYSNENDIKNSGSHNHINRKIRTRGENYHHIHHHHHNHQQQHHHHNHLNINKANNQRNNHVLNGSQSQSYYQLPIEPANSTSISSVASSSGCSSSSSVVSSSSSSLSCDEVEDHEDLYCDADSPSSSSASTSSLLSSTTLSLLSSDGMCSDADLANHHHHHHHHHQGLNQYEKRTKSSSVLNMRNKKNDTTNKNLGNSKKSESKSSELSLTEHHKALDFVQRQNCIGCIEEQQQQQQQGHYPCVYDLNNRTSCAVISENFYPTVIGRSEYGNFKEALYHLEKKLIATRSPEEIRGGGLLKYCNLLVKNYKPTNVYQIRTLERYMCSRFFIDFSDLNQQQAKLESYLANHFSDDPLLKFDYLTILHNVVQRSTVCLMNHELRLTLNMIRDLAYEQREQQRVLRLVFHLVATS